MQNACLADIEMRGVYFLYTDLTRANLTRARILAGTVGGSILHRADLTDASLIGTSLASADFTGAITQGLIIGDALIRAINPDEERKMISKTKGLPEELVEATLKQPPPSWVQWRAEEREAKRKKNNPQEQNTRIFL